MLSQTRLIIVIKASKFYCFQFVEAQIAVFIRHVADREMQFEALSVHFLLISMIRAPW